MLFYLGLTGFGCVLGVCVVMWRLSVYIHMFTMYSDYSHMMWLLHNIKTMQIYKFTHNPVLLLFHKPDRVSGRFITNRHD